jgi:hypothetical protein
MLQVPLRDEVLQKRPSLHNRFAKNILGIILQRGIIKRNSKNKKNVINEVRGVSVYCTL